MKLEKKSLWSGVVFSAVLSLASVGLLTLVDRLVPYSPLRSKITDLASAPAFLITKLFYPEGPHTGMGSPHWGLVFLAANLAVYWAGWFILFLMRSRLADR